MLREPYIEETKVLKQEDLYHKETGGGAGDEIDQIMMK